MPSVVVRVLIFVNKEQEGWVGVWEGIFSFKTDQWNTTRVCAVTNPSLSTLMICWASSGDFSLDATLVDVGMEHVVMQMT